MKLLYKLLIPGTILGILTVIIFHFYCFIGYDLFAVSEVFIGSVKSITEHLLQKFQLNKYLSLFFIQFFGNRFLASLIIAGLLVASLYLYKSIIKQYISQKSFRILSSLGFLVGCYLLVKGNIVVDLTSLILIFLVINFLLRLTRNKLFPLWLMIIEFFVWWTIQPYFLLFLLITFLLLWSSSQKMYSIAAVIFGVILYSGYLLLNTSVPTEANMDFISEYLKPAYLIFCTLLLAPFILRKSASKRIVLLLYSMFIVALTFYSLSHLVKYSNRNVESKIIYKYLNNEWGSLLDYATHRKDLTQTSVICINYALFKDGHLNNGMFIFDQSYSISGLLPSYGLKKNDPYFRQNFFYNKHALILSRIYYELGLYTMSYRIASDFIARYGNQPQALMLMVKYCLVLDKKEAAGNYGSILMKNPLYVKKIKTLLEKQKARNNRQFTELTALSYYPVINLELYLDEGIKNNMALQYYISAVLLSKDRKRLSKAVEYLNQIGSNELPEDLEYFILLESFMNAANIGLGNITLKKERFKKTSEFTDKLMQTSSEAEARELLLPYRNDFLYYYVFEKGKHIKTGSGFYNSDYLN